MSGFCASSPSLCHIMVSWQKAFQSSLRISNSLARVALVETNCATSDTRLKDRRTALRTEKTMRSFTCRRAFVKILAATLTSNDARITCLVPFMRNYLPRTLVAAKLHGTVLHQNGISWFFNVLRSTQDHACKNSFTTSGAGTMGIGGARNHGYVLTSNGAYNNRDSGSVRSFSVSLSIFWLICFDRTQMYKTLTTALDKAGREDNITIATKTMYVE